MMSIWLLQTPMKGLSKSASTRPVARSRLRWGARSYPFLMASLLMVQRGNSRDGVEVNRRARLPARGPLPRHRRPLRARGASAPGPPRRPARRPPFRHTRPLRLGLLARPGAVHGAAHAGLDLLPPGGLRTLPLAPRLVGTPH